MSEGTAVGQLQQHSQAHSQMHSELHQGVDFTLVRELQSRVADDLTRRRHERITAGQAPLLALDERQLALSVIVQVVADHMRGLIQAGQAPPEQEFDRRLELAVEAAMFGAGKLQYLLDDPGVENIDITGCDVVWVTYADTRGKVAAPPVADSDEELLDILRGLGAYAGMNARPLTPITPELDLCLPDGSRLSAVIRAAQRPIVSIRRNRMPRVFLHLIGRTLAAPAAGRITGRGPAHWTAPGERPGRMGSTAVGVGAVAAVGRGETGDGDAVGLVELGTITPELAAFLEAAVSARCNILIGGATDAGKTTLLRALLNCLPPEERLITIERALELGIGDDPMLHRDVVAFEEVLPDAAGLGGLSIGQLVQRTRRHHPSRVIVGEVLGPEVVEMLNAMSQGNDGSLSTIHARSAEETFARLGTYAAQHAHFNWMATHRLIGGAIDFVIFIAKNRRLGGLRTVTEVLEISGATDDRVTFSRIFGPSEYDGRAERRIDIPIMRAAQLADAGFEESTGFGYHVGVVS